MSLLQNHFKTTSITSQWLFRPSRYASLSGKYYAFVIVDDYSRYTWVVILTNKNNAFDAFRVFCKKVQNEKGYVISCI